MSIKIDGCWLAECHPNRERLRGEIERSQAEAREITRRRRAERREVLLFPWSLAIGALVVVFTICLLFDLH
jgi:hypothetical protein